MRCSFSGCGSRIFKLAKCEVFSNGKSLAKFVCQQRQAEERGGFDAEDAGAQVDGVLAANDGLAGGYGSDPDGALKALHEANFNPIPPITGQDAQVEALQRILAGNQYMTVYKPRKLMGKTAGEAAYDLVMGISLDSLVNGKSINNGTISIPFVTVASKAITKTNINDVVSDGYWTVDQICTGYVDACKAAGLMQ